jgi:hypothetical protein
MRTVSLFASNPATARRHVIDPRVINVEFGWWFPEQKDKEHSVWQSNANVLTSIEPPYDPAMGTHQLRAASTVPVISDRRVARTSR